MTASTSLYDGWADGRVMMGGGYKQEPGGLERSLKPLWLHMLQTTAHSCGPNLFSQCLCLRHTHTHTYTHTGHRNQETGKMPTPLV